MSHEQNRSPPRPRSGRKRRREPYKPSATAVDAIAECTRALEGLSQAERGHVVARLTSLYMKPQKKAKTVRDSPSSGKLRKEPVNRPADPWTAEANATEEGKVYLALQSEYLAMKKAKKSSQELKDFRKGNDQAYKAYFEVKASLREAYIKAHPDYISSGSRDFRPLPRQEENPIPQPGPDGSDGGDHSRREGQEGEDRGNESPGNRQRLPPNEKGEETPPSPKEKEKEFVVPVYLSGRLKGGEGSEVPDLPRVVRQRLRRALSKDSLMGFLQEAHLEEDDEQKLYFYQVDGKRHHKVYLSRSICEAASKAGKGRSSHKGKRK